MHRERLAARREDAGKAEAAVKELDQQVTKLETEVEEVSKAVQACKDEADTLKDTENADVQHVQVCRFWNCIHVSSLAVRGSGW